MCGATLLTNGKVLITSLGNPQLYDPSTGAFTLTGLYANVYTPNGDGFQTTVTLLPSGVVLFAMDSDRGNYSAELYDSTTNTFRLTGAMVSFLLGRTTTLLVNGKVLRAGGWADFQSSADYPYNREEQYDPATGVFTATGNMMTPRSRHVAVLLPDGAVLVTGGLTYDMGPDVHRASPELYDYSTGTFTTTGNMTARRMDHTATVLNDGRVLIAGGIQFLGSSFIIHSSAEIYTPPVLIPAPALFPLSGDGQGQGAIWHAQTGQIASAGNPAVAGEVLSMYTTSLADGGVIPPQVAIGGRLAEVVYFGAAPGYPGYYQVNFVVPGGVAPGAAVSVRLTYLSRPSNAVTIGVS